MIGGEPQDLSYRGSDTQVVIGDHNVIRECVTINRATEKEDGVTSIGNHYFLMACCHVAHDCRLGDRVIMANGTLLGGHVHVHDHASLSGAVGRAPLHDDRQLQLRRRTEPRAARRSPRTCWSRATRPAPLHQRRGPETQRLSRRGDLGALPMPIACSTGPRSACDHAREILRSEGKLVPQVNQLLDFVQQQQEGRHGRGREHQESRVNELRLAVIGGGHLGRIHARLLAAMEEVELVAAVDPDPVACQAVAEPLPRPGRTIASCSARSTPPCWPHPARSTPRSPCT